MVYLEEVEKSTDQYMRTTLKICNIEIYNDSKELVEPIPQSLELEKVDLDSRAEFEEIA